MAEKKSKEKEIMQEPKPTAMETKKVVDKRAFTRRKLQVINKNGDLNTLRQAQRVMDNNK